MNKKKIIGIGIISIILLIIFKTCGNDKPSNVKNTNSIEKYTINYDSINKIALEKIKEEPKVKDAVITDADVLYVAVLDDGTSRNGYASYCCEVLNELKTNVKTVKVVKFGSSKSPDRDNAYGILLGESSCEF